MKKLLLFLNQRAFAQSISVRRKSTGGLSVTAIKLLLFMFCASSVSTVFAAPGEVNPKAIDVSCPAGSGKLDNIYSANSVSFTGNWPGDAYTSVSYGLVPDGTTYDFTAINAAFIYLGDDNGSGTGANKNFTFDLSAVDPAIQPGQYRVVFYVDGGGGEELFYSAAPVEVVGGEEYQQKTLMTGTTGLTLNGNFTSDATATASTISAGSVACSEFAAAQTAGNLIALYDISATGSYQGDITVTIPVDAQHNGKEVDILHCNGGTTETTTTTVADGKVSGQFASLSPFGVVLKSSGEVIATMTTTQSSVSILVQWKGTAGKITANDVDLPNNSYKTIDSNDGSVILKLVGETTLEALYCSNNQLTALDVSKCTDMKFLNCFSNELSELDVSNNTKLTSLWCYSNKLTTLDVSKCTELYSKLLCYDNKLTSLDLSNCTKLYELDCHANQLNALNISKCTTLIILNCSSNQFTTLDISKCTQLASLNCSSNQLSSLDFSNCTLLSTLNCSSNQFTVLDFSNYVKLSNLNCSTNKLTALDLSNCTGLTYLFCNSNKLTTLNVSGCTRLERIDCYSNELTALDFSNCTKLKDLYCFENKLTALDASNYTNLERLSCYSNELTALNVSNCTQLQWLLCYSNKLTTLDVSNLAKMSALYCYDNQLTTLNTQGASFTNMHAQNQSVTIYESGGNWPNSILYIPRSGIEELITIDGNTYTKGANLPTPANGNTLAFNPDIPGPNQAEGFFFSGTITLDGYTPSETPGEVIATMTTAESSVNIIVEWIGSGKITANDEDLMNDVYSNNIITTNGGKVVLKVVGNAKLTYLDCEDNQLTALDVTKCTDLTFLNCKDNQLSALDISKCTELTGLECGFNQLASLDVLECTKLAILVCNGNQLTALDVSKCTELVAIKCFSNQLSTLDVSKCTKLTSLECFRNQLSTLDLSKCTELNLLDCTGNQIALLDMSKCIKLTTLGCEDNQLTTLNVTNCDELLYLYCSVNQLTTLDVSMCPKLRRLYCESNQLSTLNIQNCSDLTDLQAKNQSVTVYKSGGNWLNPILYTQVSGTEEGIVIESAPFVNGDILPTPANGNTLTFTTSKTVSLLSSNVFSGTITLDVAPETTVEIATMTTASSLVNIRVEWTGSGKITANDEELANDRGEKTVATNGGKVILKAVGDAKLTYLNCEGNKLTALDISKNTKLETLICSENLLAGLSITENTKLLYLECSDNQLTTLDVSKNTELDTLICRENLLTGLSITENTKLLYLECSNNQLTALDISKNIELESLYCRNNQLTELDVTKNVKLLNLFFPYNLITYIDVSELTDLISIDCSGNKLTAGTINVEKNTNLRSLGCNNCGLTTIDVSKNTALSSLFISGNNLTELDVSTCMNLILLYCDSNKKLTSLDVSDKKKLTQLYCYNNQLTTLNIKGCEKLVDLHAEKQSITVFKSGDKWINPILYTNETAIENIKIDGKTYAKDADLPTPANGNKLTFTTNNTASPFSSWVFSGTITLENSSAPINVTGVTMSPTTLSLETGQTGNLTATVEPVTATDKTVAWSTSNSSIATVDASGVVTAIAEGTATITVTTNDGGEIATCSVSVSNPAPSTDIDVTGVVVSLTTLSLEVGQTGSLSVTVTPATATNKAVTWSSSNPGVATVDASGVVTAIAAGTATITVTTADGGMTDRCSVTVSNTTGNENIGAVILYVYPNPVQNIATIKGLNEGDIVRLYSLFGSLLQTYTSHGTEMKIDMSIFSKGVYLLNVNGKTLKLIKD